MRFPFKFNHILAFVFILPSLLLVQTFLFMPRVKAFPAESFAFLVELDSASNLRYNLLFLLALSSLTVYSIILAGWSSNSKYAFIGALRSAAQMISYEVTITLVLLPIALMAGALNLPEIALGQYKTIWYASPLLPLVLMFLVAMLAETNRTPFDLPEAEAELVAGYNVDYSALPFAMFFLGEYSNMILISVLFCLLFLGGWTLLSFGAPLLLVSKAAFLWVFFVLVRASLPRYRYDQLMDIGWKTFLPIAGGFFIFVTGVIVARDVLPVVHELFFNLPTETTIPLGLIPPSWRKRIQQFGDSGGWEFLMLFGLVGVLYGLPGVIVKLYGFNIPLHSGWVDHPTGYGTTERRFEFSFFVFWTEQYMQRCVNVVLFGLTIGLFGFYMRNPAGALPKLLSQILQWIGSPAGFIRLGSFYLSVIWWRGLAYIGLKPDPAAGLTLLVLWYIGSMYIILVWLPSRDDRWWEKLLRNSSPPIAELIRFCRPAFRKPWNALSWWDRAGYILLCAGILFLILFDAYRQWKSL